ncbi:MULTISPECIES: glycosyltransferase family 4 protein [Thermodesulfovibrio]|jgi:glycosyltransferase involved in cell wall biosynthesis|uniref:glycosyltransferase family 4 protein n=1 Tax=Thermodesulfovibrio TaxID=28261 RepID=UPI00261C1919|nr:glycosyltransferase family 4 protein [Thermodesulfovibrio sp.]
MHILYVYGASSFGGATKSLLYLINKLLEFNENVSISILTIKKLKKYFDEEKFNCIGIRWISKFDITQYGHYRGLRWLVLFREVLFLASSILKLYKIIRSIKPDIVHLNDATFFFYAPIIKFFQKDIKVILHVRCLIHDKKNLRIKFFKHILDNYIDQIISIDETVRENLLQLTRREIQTIHNGFEINNYLNTSKSSRCFSVGFIGVLYRAKGIYELMEAIKILLLKKEIKDIKFIIAGLNTREIKNSLFRVILKKLKLYEDTEKDLLDFIKIHNFEENVIYMGFVEDVNTFYTKIDLLVFPSHLNAVGRPVFEAGFYGIPSIVAVRNPKPDTIIDMETGICIDYPDPEKIAEKIELLYKDRALLEKLGRGAKRLVNKYFDAKLNAKRIMDIYNILH